MKLVLIFHYFRSVRLYVHHYKNIVLEKHSKYSCLLFPLKIQTVLRSAKLSKAHTSPNIVFQNITDSSSVRLSSLEPLEFVWSMLNVSGASIPMASLLHPHPPGKDISRLITDGGRVLTKEMRFYKWRARFRWRIVIPFSISFIYIFLVVGDRAPGSDPFVLNIKWLHKIGTIVLSTHGGFLRPR